MKPLLAVCVAVAGLTACAPAVRQSPITTIPDEPQAAADASSEGNVLRPAPRPKHKGGVDLSTGVYTREDDDLVVNTTMPLVLRRTYNSGDDHERQFGFDWTHPGEWWLFGDGNPRIPWADLILADGGQIHFVRVSAGETQQDAVLRHDATPTEFGGALLSWNGSLWEVRFRDDSTASFLDCNGGEDICSLVERRDSLGNRIAYVRDKAGKLLKMDSEGQSIAFDYDNHKRITRAYDSQHHEVTYRYDDRGHLRRVEGSDGTVREYAYDERGHLTSIREPGRIITNWYDDSGRWAKQTVKQSDDDPETYQAAVEYRTDNGSIVETSFDEGEGVTVTRYSSEHYIESETLDADSDAPIVFSYARDAINNDATGATLSCVGETARVTRMVPLSAAKDDVLKANLVRAFCVRQR
jgi:YD repeat-containing protein